MKQWIIDRYNKGQDKYYISEYGTIREYYYVNNEKWNKQISELILYDFLFNPKWGFAKAFWDDEEVGCYCGNTYGFCLYRTAEYFIEKYKYHIQQLAISNDPLEYLEQFKEE